MEIRSMGGRWEILGDWGKSSSIIHHHHHIENYQWLERFSIFDAFITDNITLLL
jgi:hypothetical protein